MELTLQGSRLRLLVVASLALNLFLGGILAGGWIEDWRRGPEARPGRPAPLHFRFGRIIEHLPPGDAKLAHALMGQHREAMRVQIQALRQARKEVREVLVAETFDRARFETALRALRSHASASRAAMHRATAELAEQISAEGRRALAQGMHRRRRPGRPRTPKPEP